MKSSTSQNGRRVPICAPRRSGLTNLQLAQMGKGVVQAYRPMSRAEAEAWADRRDLRDGGR